MARINIEDTLFRDSRFLELVLSTGNRWTALGMVTEAWYLAQEYFLNEESDRMIPLEVWRKRKAPDVVISAGLAEVRDDKVYVCGSSEQFDWLLQKAESGKRGGIASAQKRAQAKLNQIQAPLESATAESSEAQANPSESNPLTLSLSLSLNNTLCEAAPVAAEPKNVVAGFFEPEPPQEIEEIKADELPLKILTALNTICFTGFRPGKANMGFINARVKEGYSYEDFVAVIKHRQKLWGNDKKMSEYLRPKTLFNSENFDGYLQASKNADKPIVDPLDAFFEPYLNQNQESAS